MVVKNWLNKIGRFMKFKREEIETTPVPKPVIYDDNDEVEAQHEPDRETIANESDLRNSYAVANILIEDEKDMDTVTLVYDSHECMRQFLYDLALACDLEVLMEEYGVHYDSEASVDKNFTELIKKFLAGKAGKCV